MFFHIFHSFSSFVAFILSNLIFSLIFSWSFFFVRKKKNFPVSFSLFLSFSLSPRSPIPCLSYLLFTFISFFFSLRFFLFRFFFISLLSVSCFLISFFVFFPFFLLLVLLFVSFVIDLICLFFLLLLFLLFSFCFDILPQTCRFLCLSTKYFVSFVFFFWHNQ